MNLQGWALPLTKSTLSKATLCLFILSCPLFLSILEIITIHNNFLLLLFFFNRKFLMAGICSVAHCWGIAPETQIFFLICPGNEWSQKMCNKLSHGISAFFQQVMKFSRWLKRVIISPLLGLKEGPVIALFSPFWANWELKQRSWQNQNFTFINRAKM